MKLTHKEKKLICLLHDLPVVERPFQALAERLGESERWVLDRLKCWKKSGRLRKLSGIGRHRRMGYLANAMLCWQALPRQARKLGAGFSALSEVSHCYQRKTNALWPYSIYTMVHAKTKGELARIIEKMVALAGGVPYRVLVSRREYKKASPVYFGELKV